MSGYGSEQQPYRMTFFFAGIPRTWMQYRNRLIYNQTRSLSLEQVNCVPTHLPLHVGDEIGQVGAVQSVEQVHLVPVVSPGAEGQVALLQVEGEEGHVHGAGALGDGRLVPHDLAVVAENHVGLHGARELVVSTMGAEEGSGSEQISHCSGTTSPQTHLLYSTMSGLQT